MKIEARFSLHDHPLVVSGREAYSDLETLVSFMSTWVSKSDEDDWKNLKRGLAWVNNTIEYKHVIIARNFSEVFTWIDESYAVHNNMRSQTSGAISMRYVIIHGETPKQKINVKISTEAELVEMSE